MSYLRCKSSRRFQSKKFLAVFVTVLIAVSNVYAQEGSANIQLEGQIVCCLECWNEKDRTKEEWGTAEDLLAARGCIDKGDPTLIAVQKGDKFTFYEIKERKFKHNSKDWHGFIGKSVRISGSLVKREKRPIVFVDELMVLKESLASRRAKKIVGTVVPFESNDLFGNKQNIDQFRGRIVVLNFWATYCPPCLKEMPDLAAIQNEFAAFGVQVIGASADESEDREKVIEFVRETKVNFPIWMTASAEDMIRYGLGGALPGTVIIDRDGKVVKVISGVITKETLRKDIESILADKASLDSEPSEKAVASKKKEARVASSVPS